MLQRKLKRSRTTLIALITFQLVCAVMFIADTYLDILAMGEGRLPSWQVVPEIVATIGLFVGIAFEFSYLRHILEHQEALARGLSVAHGALADLIEEYFDAWGLTPTEKDVATFQIKGYSITEMAKLRGSAEATIKTHLNAIYRKAGVSGRTELVSILIEDLMRAPLIGEAGTTAGERGAAGAPGN